jgi:hypothetical protein
MEALINSTLDNKQYEIKAFKEILINLYRDNDVKIPSHYVMYMMWEDYCKKGKVRVYDKKK